jgi:hypothetical protein
VSAASPLRECAQCHHPKPESDFIGRRGRPVTYCSACRTKYHGSPHESGTANVGTNRYVRPQKSRSTKTENRNAMAAAMRAVGRVHLRIVESGRPKTRGDCAGVARPCPWISCRYSTYLDVNEKTGSITYNWPGLEPDEVSPDTSCALDIADRGGASLVDLGELSNVTRERVRQIEAMALGRIRHRSGLEKNAAGKLLEFCDAPNFAAAETGAIGRLGSAPPPEVSFAEDEVVEEPPTRISFFAEGPGSDDLVCMLVWQMYARDSNNRGVRCRSKASICATNALRQRDGSDEH